MLVGLALTAVFANAGRAAIIYDPGTSGPVSEVTLGTFRPDLSTNPAGSSADGSQLDGVRVFFFDFLDTTFSKYGMLVFEMDRPYDGVRLYTHQDHYNGGPITNDFIAQDVMEYGVWGSNAATPTGLADWTLLSDVTAFAIAGGGAGLPTYTFAGIEPTVVYRGGSAEFAALNAYTREYIFPTKYKWIGFRSSTISILASDADPEIDAIGGFVVQERVGAVALTPATSTNAVGTAHTVTATLTDSEGEPQAGVLVAFSVAGANAGAAGTCAPNADCTTNAAGVVTFTYIGTSLGDDTIKAEATLFDTPKSAQAAKTWVAGCQGGQCAPSCAFRVASKGRFNNLAVIEGDVGANNPDGFARVGRNAFMADGTTLEGASVTVGNFSSVFDVKGDVHLGRGAVVRGSPGDAQLPLQSPYCPIPEAACGGDDVEVGKHGASVLTPGTYRSVHVMNDGALTLNAGHYDLCGLSVGRRVKVRIVGAGPTVIDIVGNLRLANQSTFQPDPGAPPVQVNVGGKRVMIGQKADVQAVIAAPHARLSVGNQARVKGAFCVERAFAGKGIQLQCATETPPGTTTTTTSTTTTTTTTSTTTTTTTTTSTTTTTLTTTSTTTTTTTSTTHDDHHDVDDHHHAHHDDHHDDHDHQHHHGDDDHHDDRHRHDHYDDDHHDRWDRRAGRRRAGADVRQAGADRGASVPQRGGLCVSRRPPERRERPRDLRGQPPERPRRQRERRCAPRSRRHHGLGRRRRRHHRRSR